MRMLLPLLLACAPPDPDATGARWDTAVDRRPTTTDPEALTVVDVDTTASDDTGGDPGLCLGDGQPVVRLGTGGRLQFEAYGEGDRVPVTAGPLGGLGLRLDLLSEGLDTTASMNVILRVRVDGEGSIPTIEEEYLALVKMQCPTPGPGWVQVFATLHEDLQEPASTGRLEGMTGKLSLSIIDQHLEEDTIQLDIVLD